MLPISRYHSAVTHQLGQKEIAGNSWAQVAMHLLIRNTVLLD